MPLKSGEDQGSRLALRLDLNMDQSLCFLCPMLWDYSKLHILRAVLLG